MIDMNKHIEQQLADINVGDIVEEEVCRQVTKQISVEVKRAIGTAVREQIDKIIAAEIAIAMSGQVITDDGFGKRETFESFEQLFKREFRKRLLDSWEMKKTLSNAVSDTVNNLMQKQYRDVTQKLVDSLVATLK